MAQETALASAHLARYEALLRVTKTLAGHKTMAELFEVLADHTDLLQGVFSGILGARLP